MEQRAKLCIGLEGLMHDQKLFAFADAPSAALAQRGQIMKVYGEIPGVPIGTLFEDRAALHREGVHGPLMAGISGSSTEAADSIVLSGGYEDDQDQGDVIVYTGQGGNDPVTKHQVADQPLSRGNMGLVKSLMDGVPVRVIRGARHDSPLAPAYGYRYDGLFMVEAYWQEQGRSGFRIWRYRLSKIDEQQLTASDDSEGATARRPTTVSRIIRNTATAARVKKYHDFRCQVCGEQLLTPIGPYAEAAHIKPLGTPHNGPDTEDNILCLCPNHHVLFDLGAIAVEDNLTLRGVSGSLRTVDAHSVNLAHIRHHRQSSDC